MSKLGDLDTSEVSHVLFALRPESLQSRDIPFAEIPTKHLQGFLIRATAELELVKQSQFFSLISTQRWFKGSAGNMFEKFVHVRLTAHPSSQPLIGIPANSQLPQLIIPVCTKRIPLGGLSRLKKANEYDLPFCWRPTNQSYTTVDAIVCTEEGGILIQSTISEQRDAKPEGVHSIHENLPKRFWDARRWAFVFITDTDDNAVALRSQRLDDLPENIDVYSCTFKIGQSVLTSEEVKVLEDITVSGYSVYVPVVIECIFRTHRKTSTRIPRIKSSTRRRKPWLKRAIPECALYQPPTLLTPLDDLELNTAVT
jgi:hypothetical protein